MMACVFSGQGAQKPGMGIDLYESDPAAREIYRTAENVLGYDLLTLDEQQLVQTCFAQPAIVAMSLSVWSAFVRQAPKVPVMAFAGFSLGEYSALGAAGVLEPPDLLALVQDRARLMQEVAEIHQWRNVRRDGFGRFGGIGIAGTGIFCRQGICGQAQQPARPSSPGLPMKCRPAAGCYHSRSR